MDLLFDTETTGLPAKGTDPAHSSYPHILQLAAGLRERSTSRLVSVVNVLVCPEQDFEIHPKAQEVHGITADEVRMYGMPASKALSLFRILAQRADRLVAFNIDYDWGLIKALAYRSNIGWENLPAQPRFCAMRAATPLCKLPPTDKMVAAGRANQYKPPSLSEAYRALIDPAGFAKAHDAFADIAATNKILEVLEATA